MVVKVQWKNVETVVQSPSEFASLIRQIVKKAVENSDIGSKSQRCPASRTCDRRRHTTERLRQSATDNGQRQRHLVNNEEIDNPIFRQLPREVGYVSFSSSFVHHKVNGSQNSCTVRSVVTKTPRQTTSTATAGMAKWHNQLLPVGCKSVKNTGNKCQIMPVARIWSSY